MEYQIGCARDNSIHILLTANSGAGLFSKGWNPISIPYDKPITSGTLHALFKGKSVNTAGFLLSAFIHEGLIKVISEKPCKYERQDTAAFNAGIQALLDTSPKPAKAKKPAKNKDI